MAEGHRTWTEEQIDAVLGRFADGFSHQRRSPLLHSPAEYGLAHEDVSFPSRDGVPLEGWFIPAPGSNKLVIANHPMGFTRSGMPTHLEPWHSEWAASGNGFEVDFVPDYVILHEAGYNVLAYDLRNHGLSGAANGGITSSGIFEARDVAGSVAYARSHPELRDMTIGLFSRCLGAGSTFAAMKQFPEVFEPVRCLVAPQPVTARVIVERRLEAIGLGGRIDDFEQRIVQRTGIGFAARNVREWAGHVSVPTYLYQVRDDVLTHPSDVQAMFDNIPVWEKTLHWIEGTTARWDGYLEFQRRPEPMLDWFTKYMVRPSHGARSGT
ncbi:alpha/beta hydrolase [Streptomyces samsunensis]|uniref:alpha/beta hydrolase n=1 Tax=Streptomyces malaysiensis TaxID=92644 RepID=UPI0015841ED6|nr:alpha/beta hydrolase [Streptomyces samsunensis]NUH40214.1 alpha/beta hydrolase [Streptomyces samsunensis]